MKLMKRKLSRPPTRSLKDPGGPALTVPYPRKALQTSDLANPIRNPIEKFENKGNMLIHVGKEGGISSPKKAQTDHMGFVKDRLGN